MPIGPFAGAARVLGGGMAGAEELRRRREQEEEAKAQRAIAQAAQLAGLRELGIMSESEAPRISGELPDIQVTANGHPGQRVPQPRMADTGVIDSTRYEPLGKTGYGQDPTQTKRAKDIATQREQATNIQRRRSTLRALPQYKGVDDESLTAIAMDDDAWREAIRPQKPSSSMVKAVGPDKKVRYVPSDQAAGMEAPPDSGPAGSYAPMLKPDGTPVFFNPTTRDVAEAPEGLQAGNAGQVAEKGKRIQALANVETALNALDQSLATTGSVIMPGVDKSVLETEYENLQLQLKELYNLGVLNGPDLALMRRIINDPTSLKGRAESFGSGKQQAERARAQIATVKKKIANFRENVEKGNQAGKKALSKVDAAMAKRDPQFAEWLRGQGYEVP